MFGLASVSVDADGQLITDLQGDQIEPAEMEAAFYEYVQLSGDGDAMHDRVSASKLVESFVITPEKLDLMFKALGFEADGLADFKGVAAWVGYRILSDSVWERVKSGALKAFSIEGECERVAA